MLCRRRFSLTIYVRLFVTPLIPSMPSYYLRFLRFFISPPFAEARARAAQQERA